MKKIIELLEKWIPRYCWLPIIFGFLVNTLVYSGAKMIAGGWYHYNIETSLDRMIPFIPQTLLIYFGCYAFWGINYILIASLDKKRAFRFCSADVLAKLICLFFFLVLPTTNTRPVLENGGIWNLGMRFLYWIDSPDNLFPSIHCLTSWFCYIGIRGDERIPKGYRIFSCVFAIAVFVSTLTTKQHVLADVAGGVLLAEGAYWLTGHTSIASKYESIFSKITAFVFREDKGE